ncbi:MAG: hypothetical protein ACI4TU_04415 [Candidatus Cryptobacteroides sp.]
MKGLLIIASCLAMAFVLEFVEKIRTMKKETVRVSGKEPLQEALDKYKDLME